MYPFPKCERIIARWVFLCCGAELVLVKRVFCFVDSGFCKIPKAGVTALWTRVCCRAIMRLSSWAGFLHDKPQSIVARIEKHPRRERIKFPFTELDEFFWWIGQKVWIWSACGLSITSRTTFSAQNSTTTAGDDFYETPSCVHPIHILTRYRM